MVLSLGTQQSFVNLNDGTKKEPALRGWFFCCLYYIYFCMKTINIDRKDLKYIVQETLKRVGLVCEQGSDLETLFMYLSKPQDTEIGSGRNVNINAKAYNYFEPKGIVHGVWALHYTYAEAFEDIIDNGFVHGCVDLDKLAYTDKDGSGVGDFEVNNGWCFALPIDGAYLGDDCGYGDCGFLIQTDGVRAFHKIDNDDEIIFKNDYVKQSIPFAYEEDYGGWNVLEISKKIDPNNLPNGSFYEPDINAVLFNDVRSMVSFLLRK